MLRVKDRGVVNINNNYYYIPVCMRMYIFLCVYTKSKKREVYITVSVLVCITDKRDD